MSLSTHFPPVVNLKTANQILSYFKSHPQVRVIRVCGIYQIWKVLDGKPNERMAQYDLKELKAWAAQW